MVERFRNRRGCRERNPFAPQLFSQFGRVDVRGLADERAQRGRQRLLRPGAPARVDMTQQAARLFGRRSGELEAGRIETAVDGRHGQLGGGQGDPKHQIAFELWREGEKKISSIGRSNSSAMRKASGSEGSYLP